MIRRPTRAFLLVGLLTGFGPFAGAQEPGPRLTLIHPSGGRAGTSFEVQLAGSGLDGLNALICDDPRITAVPLGNQRFTVAIPKEVPPGLYDLRARGGRGLSAPRSFFVSPLETVVAAEPIDSAQTVKAGVSISGRIEAPGNVDRFKFAVKAGRRVVIDCWAERLDSKLRAVLELENAQGVKIASNRGYNGLDPLIDHLAKADGELVVKVFDLTYTGSPEHIYRLDIDTGPRLEFARPNVVEAGKSRRVRWFGQNLSDPLESEIQAPAKATGVPRIFSRPSRFDVEEIAFDLQGKATPIALGLTDLPVVTDPDANHQPDSALALDWPVELSGRLEAGDENDWYRVNMRRGEVVWVELYGERIGSPVDLEFSVYDAEGQNEWLRVSDAPEHLESPVIPTNHSDPSGRWVAPADGSYLIAVRNVIGGNGRDPRRIYRMSIRREEPGFQLLAIPGGSRDPGVCNVARGGRSVIDLFVSRKQGYSGPIRVSASGLPSGLECPDVWFGPEVEKVSAVVSAAEDCDLITSGITLTGRAELGAIELVREARGATTIPTASATPSGRLTGRIALGAVAKTPWSISATPSRSLVSQGAIVDVAVVNTLSGGAKTAIVELWGVGLPAERDDRSGSIAPGQSKGWYSFQVPRRLAPGLYTFAIEGRTTVTRPGPKPGEKPSESAAMVISNPVTIEVVPGAFDISLDPHNPEKIKRGQVIQIQYKAFRRNGFIGKIHTELNAPDGVLGLRARGVTFVGLTDSGSLQLVASDDAPLGRQPFLRLEGVGTVEDEPIHHAGCFLDLEITN